MIDHGNAGPGESGPEDSDSPTARPGTAGGPAGRSGPGNGRALRRSAKRWREMLAAERDAAALYEALARAETGERAEILRELSRVELRHAAHWEARLGEAGLAVPEPGRVTLRTRLLIGTARRTGVDAVLPIIERAERTSAGTYDDDPDATPAMAEDERGHAVALAGLRGTGQRGTGLRGADPRASGTAAGTGTGAGTGTAAGTRTGTGTGTGTENGGSPEGPDAKSRIMRRETWHRSDRSGALRAGIFGISDGLVSNTALVMGFAGSGAGRSTVLLAGVAGLLAGSFSMAAGEYVSMAGQREMFEREIALEAAELEEKPEEEFEELVLLYRAKGLTPDQARSLARKIMADRGVALDTLVREELGLDPDSLGSPWAAAATSLLAFALGAAVVVLPYLFLGGTAAAVGAGAATVVALAAVGGGLGLLNGRSVVRGAGRQVGVGVLAAAVTFGVGALIGVRAG